jgi:hypothetical protein
MKQLRKPMVLDACLFRRPWTRLSAIDSSERRTCLRPTIYALNVRVHSKAGYFGDLLIGLLLNPPGSVKVSPQMSSLLTRHCEVWLASLSSDGRIDGLGCSFGYMLVSRRRAGPLFNPPRVSLDLRAPNSLVSVQLVALYSVNLLTRLQTSNSIWPHDPYCLV